MMPDRITGSMLPHAPEFGLASAGWMRSNARKATPPPMQAHAKPRLNQRMRLRERPAAAVVGTAPAMGPGQSVCSSALRRPIKDLVADVARSLLLLHRTARPSSNRVTHKHHPDHFLAAIVAVSVPRNGDAPQARRPTERPDAAARGPPHLLVACVSNLPCSVAKAPGMMILQGIWVSFGVIAAQRRKCFPRAD
jgi:hypothetical protein